MYLLSVEYIEHTEMKFLLFVLTTTNTVYYNYFIVIRINNY